MSKVWTTYNTRVAEGLEKSLKSLGLEYVDLFLIVSFFRLAGEMGSLANAFGSTGLFCSTRKVLFPPHLKAVIIWLIDVTGNDDKFPTRPDGSRDIIKEWNHVEAWKQMEEVFASGKAKAIGVCNVRLPPETRSYSSSH